jgi:hypothetical protein
MRDLVWLPLVFVVGCASPSRESYWSALRDAGALQEGARFEVAYTGSFLRDPGFHSEYPLRIVDFLDFQWAPSIKHPAFAHIERKGAWLEISVRGVGGTEYALYRQPISEVLIEGRTVVRHDEKRSIGDEWSTTRFVEHQDFFITPQGDLIVRVVREGVGTSFLYRKDLLMSFPKWPNQSPEPTVMSVTPRADARVAPALTVAHL